jgi:hypothetical protein
MVGKGEQLFRTRNQAANPLALARLRVDDLERAAQQFVPPEHGKKAELRALAAAQFGRGQEGKAARRPPPTASATSARYWSASNSATG